MCWSWPVSLTFSLFQWICIAYMLHRNAIIDRWMSLYQAIIATQEFAQFLLWAFVFGAGNRIETVDECSTLNQALSYILLIVVEAMPWILCLIFIQASVPSVMTGIVNKSLTVYYIQSLNMPRWRRTSETIHVHRRDITYHAGVCGSNWSHHILPCSWC